MSDGRTWYIRTARYRSFAYLLVILAEIDRRGGVAPTLRLTGIHVRRDTEGRWPALLVLEEVDDVPAGLPQESVGDWIAWCLEHGIGGPSRELPPGYEDLINP